MAFKSLHINSKATEVQTCLQCNTVIELSNAI